MLNAGTPADFELYQQVLPTVSLSDPREHCGPISWELARDALLLFYVDHREVELARMEGLLTFWRQAKGHVGGWPVEQQLDRLLQWFNVRPAGKATRRWRARDDVFQAVTPPLDRSAGNILSELHSALQGKQYADAARIVIGTPPPAHNAAGGTAVESLVDSPEDNQLFVSYTIALRLLLLQHRGFREAMEQQIGPADRLKIEQTLVRGDPAAIESLSLQYGGTPAAAAPCQWLGDRALAAADFDQAAAWYDEGLRGAVPANRPDLAARKRLVAAMLGADEGQPPAQAITLGGTTVPPQRFEGWIHNLLARRKADDDVSSATDTLPVVGAVQPVGFQTASFALLEDNSGRSFRGDEVPWVFRDVDWTWRNLILRPAGDSLLAVERSRIVAFGSSGGKPRWDVRLGNGWASAPVRPLVRGQHIYIRAASTPERIGVACLDAKTGRRLWLADCDGAAISDPLWHGGRLFVLVLGPAGGEFAAMLCLVELHPETGEVLCRRQIIETAQREHLPGECQAVLAGSRLVVLVAGSVIATDLQGRIAWMRQETVLPNTIDPGFMYQHCQGTIESAGRLFVQQPGSCAIDSLDLETGQRRWQRGIVGLQSIADLPDDRLLAQTAKGLAALSKTTGEMLWQREFPGILPALARTASGLIVAARQTMVGDKPQIEFLWIDAATGRASSAAWSWAHGLMPLEKNRPVCFGPIASHGDRVWCCFGHGPRNDSRTAENPKQIMELRPGGSAAELERW